MKSGEADEQTYQVMGAIQLASGDKKKARNTLQKGIERYPKSGILYHDLGKLYEEQDEMENALTAWLNGIEQDPAYHLNYYQAARSYLVGLFVSFATLHYRLQYLFCLQAVPGEIVGTAQVAVEHHLPGGKLYSLAIGDDSLLKIASHHIVTGSLVHLLYFRRGPVLGIADRARQQQQCCHYINGPEHKQACKIA